MCKVFYSIAITSDVNFGYVYIEDGVVLGFVLGTSDNSKTFSGLRVRVEIIFALFKNPFLLKDFFSHYKSQFPASAERLYGAVDECCRQKGVALQLYSRLNQGFKERNIFYFEDSVDADNTNSIALLRFLGAKMKEKYNERGISRYRLFTKLS